VDVSCLHSSALSGALSGGLSGGRSGSHSSYTGEGSNPLHVPLQGVVAVPVRGRSPAAVDSNDGGECGGSGAVVVSL
jgi:hypothetical protein